MPRKRTTAHPSRSDYVRGCSCDDCREANRLYQEGRRRARGVRPIGPRTGHGSTGCYRRGCRCELCRAANTDDAGRSVQLVEVDLERRLRQTIEAGLPYAAFPHGFLSDIEGELIVNWSADDDGTIGTAWFVAWAREDIVERDGGEWSYPSFCARLGRPEPWQLGLVGPGDDHTLLACLLEKGHEGDHGFARVAGSFLPRTDPLAL